MSPVYLKCFIGSCYLGVKCRVLLATFQDGHSLASVSFHLVPVTLGPAGPQLGRTRSSAVANKLFALLHLCSLCLAWQPQLFFRFPWRCHFLRATRSATCCRPFCHWLLKNPLLLSLGKVTVKFGSVWFYLFYSSVSWESTPVSHFLMCALLISKPHI